jgi:hypothetical protein
MRQNLQKTFLFLMLYFILINLKAQTSCSITCPLNITTAATSSSGAVVNYDISSLGDCSSILSLPGAGSSFPIGTTTVNVYTNTNVEYMYVLTSNGLYKFDPGNQPGTLSGPIAITGLPAGYAITSIDFSPTGQLYGLGKYACNGSSPPTCARIFAINKITGAATQIGTQDFTLINGGHELEFDPVANVLHIIGSIYQEHYLVDITTGYAVYNSFKEGSPHMKGVAFSNNYPGAISATLYAVGTDGNLHTIGGMHGDPAPSMTAINLVGDLNPDPNGPFVGVSTDRTGFDISQRGNAYMISDNNLSSINLNTGEASLHGIFSFATISDFSIEPETLPSPACSFTVTVMLPPPTVTINKASTQFDPTTAPPVRFTVVFNEEVTGFDASDISFAGSTVPGNLVATVTGTGPIYTVSVTGFTGVGNVVASVIAGAAFNNNNISSLASTSTDNVVAVVSVPHNLSITKTSQATYVAAGGIIPYIITAGRIPIPPGPRINNVTITDVLPPGTKFIGFQPISSNSVAPIVSFPPVNQNGTVTLVFPIFDMGDFYSFRLLVAVDAAMTGTISNTATVGGPLGDVDPANNSATAVVQIVVPPTLTCPSNVTLYASAETCTAAYTILPEHFTVTGGGTTIAIDADNGQHNFGTANLTNNGVSSQLRVGTYTVEATATNAAGTASCTYTITVIDITPPTILQCPNDITVNNDPGKCTALVGANFQIEEKCSNVLNYSYNGSNGSSSGSGTIYGLSFGRTFSVGEHNLTAVFTDDHGNSSSCSFKITVVDNEKPVITTCPAAVTVECVSQIPAVNIASVSATDNCGTPTITHAGDVITNQTCANKFTLMRTYKATDGSGNTATCSQTITVDDKTPPTITGLTASKSILAPPNHKMVDVYLDYTIRDNCVSTPNVTISITSNEPVNGTGDGDTDPDWEIIDKNRIRLRAERAGNGTGRIYTITVTVNDGCNAPVSATTEVRVAHNITGPQSGNSFKIGSTVAFTGEFWDVPGNIHSAKWLIDGSTTVKGIVTEPSGNKNGKITGSYKFTAPGIYKLQMNTTDQKGVTTYANTNGDVDAIVVIYDPNGGHAYGGGYYDSPVGALVADPSSTGKASYGFAMNYFKNSTNPKGETQFEFKVGSFEFNALNFDYLVISNSMAQFKGTGKIIGGQSGIGFTMTVVDGQLDGSGVDKIRMKIYNKNNGRVIYDNQPGASDAALPIQAVGANSIVVISGTNSLITSARESAQAEMNLKVEVVARVLEVIAFPNPSASHFTVNIKGNNKAEKIIMQVVDMYGRIIETRNVTVSPTIHFGDGYIPGYYFLRIIQGKEHKEIKLVKLPG